MGTVPVIVALWLTTAAPPQLAAPGFSAVNLDPKVGEFYTEHLAQKLTVAGIRVVTAREINAIIGLERQKQLLGCEDESSSSCMAELAGALGVDGIIMGDVAKIGAVFQLNVRVVASGSGKTLSVYSAQVRQEEQLLEELSRAAQRIAADVNPSKPPSGVETPVAAETASPPSRRGYAWIPAVVGGGLLLTSVLFELQAVDRHQRLTELGATPIDPDVAPQVAAEGQRAQTVAAITGAGAAVALGVSAAFLFGAFDGSAKTSMSVALAPSGASVSFGGSF